MKRYVPALAAFAILFFVVSSRAQEHTGYPAAEIFGGYSYLSHGAGDPTGSTNRQNLNGFGISVAGNVNEWFGVEGEFGGHYASNCFGSILNCHNTSFMGGPKVSFRGAKATGFFHGLLGIDHGVFGLSGVSVSDNKFAFGFGGGVDVRANDIISIRAGQIDFIAVHHFDSLGANRQNNVRISAGITLTLARH